MYSDDAYTPGHSDYVTTDDHSYQYPSSYPSSYSDYDGYSSTPAVDDGALQLGNLDGSKSLLNKAAGDSVLPHAVTSVSEHVHSHTAVKLAHAVTHVSEHATGHQAAHVGHDARTVRSQHEEKVSSEGAAAHEMTGHAHAKEELASEEKHTHAEAGTTLKASTTLKAATTTLAAVMFGGRVLSISAVLNVTLAPPWPSHTVLVDVRAEPACAGDQQVSQRFIARPDIEQEIEEAPKTLVGLDPRRLNTPRRQRQPKHNTRGSCFGKLFQACRPSAATNFPLLI